MYDPMVVAFEIRRPWPRRSLVVGRRYWPALITIWHVEPNGHDSGEVCKHSHRWQEPDGTWKSRPDRRWKWHVHHWRIQVIPLQTFQRWAFTRCEWCGGKSRKGDPVNVSNQWDRDREPWWRGERGLFHSDCSSISTAHVVCTCERDEGLGDPRTNRCLRCDKPRKWDQDTDRSPYVPANRILASIPAGERDPEKRAQAAAMWRAWKRATDEEDER